MVELAALNITSDTVVSLLTTMNPSGVTEYLVVRTIQWTKRSQDGNLEMSWFLSAISNFQKFSTLKTTTALTLTVPVTTIDALGHFETG